MTAAMIRLVSAVGRRRFSSTGAPTRTRTVGGLRDVPHPGHPLGPGPDLLGAPQRRSAHRHPGWRGQAGGAPAAPSSGSKNAAAPGDGALGQDHHHLAARRGPPPPGSGSSDPLARSTRMPPRPGPRADDRGVEHLALAEEPQTARRGGRTRRRSPTGRSSCGGWPPRWPARRRARARCRRCRTAPTAAARAAPGPARASLGLDAGDRQLGHARRARRGGAPASAAARPDASRRGSGLTATGARRPAAAACRSTQSL